MKKTQPVIMWFRRDLRLADNPALSAVNKSGNPIICIFIWSLEEHGEWANGGASRWWLHQSLDRLDRELRNYGSRLVILKGETLTNLESLIHETGACATFWNRCYEPSQFLKDIQITQALQSMNVNVQTFNGSLLFEPQEMLNKSGQPYQVFTPFWKACLQKAKPEKPLPPPNQLTLPATMPSSHSLESLDLEPKIDWAAGIRSTWKPGEQSAQTQLQEFINDGMLEYESHRDRPDLTRSSRLSPYLHFGEISPRQIWHTIEARSGTDHRKAMHRSAVAFLRQLGWREFAYHLLHYFPHTTKQPLRADFERFPWEDNGDALKAWQKGKTGYPLVDAGMRELWVTGWMHNRVRLVAASFLIKHLLIPWQRGAEWFWDTLVDADLANNTLGWQWVAGCGADAAPYFRIFNPVTQAMKFDPQGNYVRRWVPELNRLPYPWIHKPWEAPPLLLKEAGIRLGQDYPLPIIDHARARQRALNALANLKNER